MLKKLFGLGRKEEEQAKAASPRAPSGPPWGEPERPYQNYYNLHLYGASLDEAEQAIAERYLLHGQPGTPGALLVQAGGWTNVYFPASIVERVGFNRLASQIARERGDWVIGYRIFADQGIDAHYFQGPDHVDQLALSGDELEFEPESPARFVALGDVRAVIPRPATQHPLDFHFDLLEAIGIVEAALSWEEAYEKEQAGGFDEARLLGVEPGG